jgi:hypothetical protein
MAGTSVHGPQRGFPKANHVLLMTTTRSQDKEANQKERRERTRKRKRAVKREKKEL